jgi:hypothetical protein
MPVTGADHPMWNTQTPSELADEHRSTAARMHVYAPPRVGLSARMPTLRGERRPLALTSIRSTASYSAGWPIPAPAPATRSWSPRPPSRQPSAFRPGFASD